MGPITIPGFACMTGRPRTEFNRQLHYAGTISPREWIYVFSCLLKIDESEFPRALYYYWQLRLFGI